MPAIFEGPALPYDELVAGMFAGRLPALPRYRQKVRFVPGSVGRPVWVDDPHFDLVYHLRHTALPPPGTEHELQDLMGRLMSVELDRRRPLWEAWMVEGLTDGRWAVISKVHHCMVDGVSGTDLMVELLGASPEEQAPLPDTWAPRPEPPDAVLTLDALVQLALRPARRLRAARATVQRPGRAVATLRDTLGGLLTYGEDVRPTPALSIEGAIGPHRGSGAVVWAPGGVPSEVRALELVGAPCSLVGGAFGIRIHNTSMARTGASAREPVDPCGPSPSTRPQAASSTAATAPSATTRPTRTWLASTSARALWWPGSASTNATVTALESDASGTFGGGFYANISGTQAGAWRPAALHLDKTRPPAVAAVTAFATTYVPAPGEAGNGKAVRTLDTNNGRLFASWGESLKAVLYNQSRTAIPSGKERSNATPRPCSHNAAAMERQLRRPLADVQRLRPAVLRRRRRRQLRSGGRREPDSDRGNGNLRHHRRWWRRPLARRRHQRQLGTRSRQRPASGPPGPVAVSAVMYVVSEVVARDVDDEVGAAATSAEDPHLTAGVDGDDRRHVGEDAPRRRPVDQRGAEGRHCGRGHGQEAAARRLGDGQVADDRRGRLEARGSPSSQRPW